MIYLSLGAGVQSTALLILSASGRCPKADVAIFADTQDEPSWVYEQLEYLRGITTIPIETVTVGQLSRSDSRFLRIPAYTMNEDGSIGMLRRQCTREYKIAPIQKRVRELLGLKPGERSHGRVATAQIGISTDEAHRAKDSDETYIRKTYPLLDLRMNRSDCVRFLEREGVRVPRKSACVFCPYHENGFWLDLKRNHGDEWQKVVEYDEKIRNSTRAGVIRPAFIHRSAVAMPLVDLNETQIELFGNECEGLCGV